MTTNSPLGPERKPPIPHSSYKPSPAKRTRAAFTQLCCVLSKEWDSIRSLNLGVKSGTGVIEDVLITQLDQLANTVHKLAVADAEASRVLVQQARKLSKQQFQHVQVLLDMLGLDELSDFLRLMCDSSSTSNSSKGAASTHAGAMRPSSSASMTAGSTALATAALAAGAVSFKSAGSAHDVDNYGATSSSSARSRSASRQRRQRAAAGVFELPHAAYSHAPATLQHSMLDEQQHQQQNGGDNHSYGRHASPEASPPGGLRFAHLLPPGHILVKTAQALKQQHEFQAALAAATPRPARQMQLQARVLPLEPQQQDDQQSLLPSDLLDKALGHLQGYRMGPAGPLSVEGTWQQQQQQQQSNQSGTGASVNSDWPELDSASRQQSTVGHSHMHVTAAGPWRGSLMTDEAHAGVRSWHGLQQLQQQHHHQQSTGAFFLSSYGSQQAQPYSTGQLRYQQQQLLQQQRQHFRAPPVSLQQLWKSGRAATTAAVLDAAHLPVHDLPGDVLSLILAPGLVA